MKITVKEARQLAKWLDGIVRTEHSCKTRSMREAVHEYYNGATSALRLAGLNINPCRCGEHILHGVNGLTANN